MSPSGEHQTPGKQCRLIYKSQTSWDLLSNESLMQLARSSAENNAARDISGLLVLSGECFLQVLEGPSDAVNALYLKIAADKRHQALTLLSFEATSQRKFKDWAMHVVDLLDLPVSQRAFFEGKYPAEDGSIAIPDEAPLAIALLTDVGQMTRAESEPSS